MDKSVVRYLILNLVINILFVIFVFIVQPEMFKSIYFFIGIALNSMITFQIT